MKIALSAIPDRQLGMLIVAFALFLFGLWYVFVTNPATYIAKIELIDAPEYCVSSTSRFKKRERSSAPKFHGAAYCGYVITDIGIFRIAESGPFYGLFSRREKILNRLKPNCTYRIDTTGFSELEDTPKTNVVEFSRTIVDVSEALHCDSDVNV
jgi:hypothetical protein